MSNGGGQHKVWGPYWDSTNSTMYQSIYVYAFVAGAYSVAKNFWTSEDKTGAVTSRQGGTDGTVDGYFDGDYNIEIRASDDTTVIKQYANVKLTSDTSTMWEGNQGTAFPAAAAANKGHMFAKIDGSNILRAVGVNQNTSFIEIYSADSSGNQQIGSAITKTHPWYDITHPDWGAVAGQASDQSTSIQAAITAIAAAGSGVLYIPKGTYQVDSSLDIDNTSITIIGDGSGQSVLKQTVDPSAPMLDFDTTDKTDKVTIQGVSFTTTVAGSSEGIDLLWASASGNDKSNLLIDDVYIGPHSSASGTAYFSDCLKLTESVKELINNVTFSGHDTLTSGCDGIDYATANDQSRITNCIFQNLEFGILHTAGSGDTLIDNCYFDDNDTAIGYSLSSNRSTISNCIFNSIDTTCIFFGGASPIAHRYHTITGCYISGATCISSSDILQYATIVGNTFITAAGTGISLGGTSHFNLISSNNFVAQTGITVAGDDNMIEGNLFTSVTTQITDTGSDNMYSNNFPEEVATVASAAALGSGVNAAKTSDIWNVTGTTTITSIHADVGPRIGRAITLQFASSLTVTDGSNLTLAGNFSATADDTMRLQYDGSNWVELSRSAN